MIIVIAGSDHAKKSKALAAYFTKNPEVVRVPIEGDPFDSARADELAASSSLLVQNERFAGIVRGACEKAENREELLSRLDMLADSPHMFILIEENIPPVAKKRLTLAAKHFLEYDAPKKDDGSRELFSFADLVIRGERKEAWLRYRSLVRRGEDPEKILGILAWKTRDALSRATREGDFRRRLAALSRAVVDMHGASRDGSGELELLIERFIAAEI